MHGLIASLALSALFVAVKFFARHGGSISALNTASSDTRKARRRAKVNARARRTNTGAAKRRAKEMRR